MILTVGATGELGGLITRSLLERGHEVRSLVRSPEAAERFASLGADPVTGDLKDYASILRACEGIDTVVTTANSALRGGEDTIETVDLGGNANLITAASAAGVSRFVFVSANGAASSSPDPFLAAKGVSEERLIDSGMTWTILAPEPFVDVWIAMVVAAPALAGGEVVYVGSGSRRHSFVVRADVAAFAVEAVDHHAAANRRLVLGGPRAFSFRDAVGAFEQMLGRSVAQRGLPPGAPIEGMPPSVVSLLTVLDTYDSEIEMGGLASEFGIRLHSLEDWAGSMAGAESVASSS